MRISLLSMKTRFQINNYIIKPYQEKDLDSFIEIFTNQELCQFMEGGAFENKKDAENLFYQLFENDNAKNNSFYLGIFISNKLIGHFEIVKNDFTKKNELEIVFLLTKEYWGKTLMKQIILEIQKAYSENFIVRIQANNNNSRKMIEKITTIKPTLSKFKNKAVIKYTIYKE